MIDKKKINDFYVFFVWKYGFWNVRFYFVYLLVDWVCKLNGFIVRNYYIKIFLNGCIDKSSNILLM